VNFKNLLYDDFGTKEISDDKRITLICFRSAYLATTVGFGLDRVYEGNFTALLF